MDYIPSISLSKNSRTIRKISPLLNNKNRTIKIKKPISLRNLKIGKKLNHGNNSTCISIYKTKKLTNLLTNDFSENHLQNMLKNNKLISFEEYNKRIEKNLSDYSIVATDSKMIIKKRYKKEYEEDKDDREKKYEENKNKAKTKRNEKLMRNNSQSCYKVTVKDFNFYKNPNESLTAINNNNEIFNEINKDCLARQRIIYENHIINFENYTQKFRVKMPKIKIFHYSSKIPSEIPVINLINEEYKNDEELSSNIHKGEEEMRLFSYYKYSPKNFPEGKEQFSFCSKGKYLYLSGGLCTNMKQMSIWSLNMETLEWNKLALKNTTYSRYGHTSIYYQNKIYFYGGTVKIEKSAMLAGLEIFSLNDRAFIMSNIKGGPSKRKNHIAEIAGNSMLIHGGIDEENQVLDECHLLNLQQMKWSVPMISRTTQFPKVYGHSSCLVVPSNVLANNSFNIYKFTDFDYINKKGKKSILRGLYIFGGKTKEINGLTNNLWILLFGQQPLQWIKAETKGIQPSPRCYHSMNFYEKSKYIIIHGGRNDDISSNCALNDTFILDLFNLSWIKVSLYSNINNFQVMSRFGHNSSIFSNKLIIFGGMNNNNYIGSSLFIVDLDLNFSNNILKNTKKLIFDNILNLKNKDTKKAMIKVQKEDQKYELGIIKGFSLPPIK